MLKLVGFASACAVAAAQKWGYGGNEFSWDNFGSCRGLMQSPININKIDSKKDRALPDLYLGYASNNTAVQTVSMFNNQQIRVTGENFPDVTMVGGIMQRTFYLQYIDFHWGGSEHLIRNNRKDGEIQFMFETKDEPKQRLGYATLLSGSSNSIAMDSMFRAVDDLITQRTDKLRATGTVPLLYQGSFTNLELRMLLPKDFEDEYYTYRGSLTTPPCTENVQWHIGRKYIGFRRYHRDILRKMRRSNYRHESKHHARQVYETSNGGDGLFGR